MVYDGQILRVLSQFGENGASVQVISKHLYNMNCTLFNVPDYFEIYNYVRQYIKRNSKSPKDLIERTGRRGYYRINSEYSVEAGQLLLDFVQSEDLEETCDEILNKQNHEDLSLDLFV